MANPKEDEYYEDENVEEEELEMDEEDDDEGDGESDDSEDFAILSTKVEAMLELMLEKKIITEAEFERKYDEICDRNFEEEDENGEDEE